MKRILTIAALVVATTSWAYRLNDNGYICDWLIRGPYPSYQAEGTAEFGGTGFNCDFFAEDQDGLGGERGCLPSLGANGAGFPRNVVFVADEAKLVAGLGATNEWGVRHNIETTVAWKELHYGPSDRCYKLDDGLKPLDDFIVNYLACYIYSPVSREVMVKGGCDDDHKIWINGEVIGYANGSSAAMPDNFAYRVNLKRGLNLMLVKIVDRIDGHGVVIGLFNANGTPADDVEIFTTAPYEEIVNSGVCARVVDWDPNCYLGMNGSDSLFVGQCKVPVTCGVTNGKTYQVKISVVQNGEVVKSVANDAVKGIWKPELEFELVKDDDVKLVAEFWETANAEAVTLYTDVEVMSGEKIRKQVERLTNENIEIKRLQETAEKNLATAKLGGETAMQLLRDEVATMEKIYRENRAVLDEMIGDAGKSLDEDLPQAPTGLRKSISLDTELWKMAKAAKMNPIVFNPPTEASAWRQEAMPFRSSNSYFRSWFYPLDFESKSPYAPHIALDGWEDFQYNDWLGDDQIWFQKDIELDFDPTGMICEYKCGAIWGRIHLFVNGELCGKWDVPIGSATIPVKGLRQGKNTVTIFFERSDAIGMHKMPYMDIYQGILGKSSLDFRPNLPDMTVVVKPSWRKAQLKVQTSFEGCDSELFHNLKIRQYVTLNGRVVKNIPWGNLNAFKDGEVHVVETSVPWTDAQCWGIGDEAGNPVLYTLVTDVLDEAGNIVDRKTNDFGFREVWSEGHFIYMNGKRIVIQGDVGYGCDWEDMTVIKEMAVRFDAFRQNGLNCIRNHDSGYWSEEFLDTCDRLGWYAYVNMYPWGGFPGHTDTDIDRIYTFEEWMDTDYHKENLRRYQNWVKMLENHPSVVIVSTDNEVATQAWDTQDTLFRNQENEKIAAWYNNYVKKLTEGRYVMTRDGDVGTWNWDGKWADEPVCDTANFHYPNYEVETRIFNWPLNFKGNRPLVYGENLYCAYFQNGWKTPYKETMLKRANEVRKQVQYVCDWEIPACIWMGQGVDGFVYYDESGKGNPLGITTAMFEGREKPCYKGWPWARVNWPALSGPGMRYSYASVKGFNGSNNINWMDPEYPSHVVTAVNDAFRENLPLQPKAVPERRAECVIRLACGTADVPITARRVDGEASREFVTLTDSQGRAYFIFGEAGKYEFRCGDKKLEADLIPMGDYILARPGFCDVPVFELK